MALACVLVIENIGKILHDAGPLDQLRPLIKK